MSRSEEELRTVLRRIDGRGYPAYRDLKGRWTLSCGVLHVDHVQGDPFAAPSRVRLELPAGFTSLPLEECRPGPRSLGTAALLARRFALAAEEVGRRGSGGGGRVWMEAPGPEVLPQTAVRVHPDGAAEARFAVGLPAAGRRILGREAEALLVGDIPRLAASALRAESCADGEIRLHARTNEDAEALRAALVPRGLVAFVADGAILPRRSGVDQAPLEGGGVVPFRSPESLAVTLDRPNGGPIRGMGIPSGVTLIVGGGFHGKSTLLRALQRGVYNHAPGDGREMVLCHPSAVKIRAEDGRSVSRVDVSPFIGELPGGRDTVTFSTREASGSTSQAASIVEALEAGARVLLVDEDTAATNLMLRDRRMQALVPREREPITPFVDRVRELHGEGVSSILVLGGSGDYLDVADTVIGMVAFRPEDLTARAREVALALPTGRASEAPAPTAPRPRRIPMPDSLDPSVGRRDVRVTLRGDRTIRFGENDIDLSAVEQLVSRAQVRAVAEALLLLRRRYMDGRASFPELLDRVMEGVEAQGLDALGDGRAGDLAGFRRFELAAALNRVRGLEVKG